MATKTAPTLETVERLLDEVEEWCGRVQSVRQKLARAKRGSEAYQALLSDLWVELDWLKLKAESATSAIDEYHESLPEDE